MWLSEEAKKKRHDDSLIFLSCVSQSVVLAASTHSVRHRGLSALRHPRSNATLKLLCPTLPWHQTLALQLAWVAS